MYRLKKQCLLVKALFFVDKLKYFVYMFLTYFILLSKVYFYGKV